MSALSSVAFQLRGQALNLSVPMKSTTSGNPLKTGLTGIVALVSTDDGAWTALATTPTEKGANSGWLTVDLSIAEMTGAKVDIEIQATGCTTQTISIAPLDLRAETARYDDEAVVRYERMGLNSHSFLLNQQDNKAAEQFIFNRNGVAFAHGVIIRGDVVSERAKLATILP